MVEASLLKEPELIYQVIEACREAVPAHIPVSAKIRLGWEHLKEMFLKLRIATPRSSKQKLTNLPCMREPKLAATKPAKSNGITSNQIREDLSAVDCEWRKFGTIKMAKELY